jgi:hypothetical protein
MLELSSDVTTVDINYLVGVLENVLQPLLEEVGALALPAGEQVRRPALPAGFHAAVQDPSSGAEPSLTVSPANGNFVVQAGCSSSNGPNGITGFAIANELNATLQTMGGSMQQQLQWLMAVLTQMIEEVQATISSMQAAEDTNQDLASLDAADEQALAQDFQITASESPTTGVKFRAATLG